MFRKGSWIPAFAGMTEQGSLPTVRDGGDGTQDLPDTVLMQRPGLEAEEIARVLNLEGIPCLLECQGMQSLRLADHEPAEPLAISLPVSVSVPFRLEGQAKEILQSLQQPDVVGDQWTANPAPAEAAGSRLGDHRPNDRAARSYRPRGASGGEGDGRSPSVDRHRQGTGDVSPEGTSLRFVIAIVLAGLAILWTIGE